MTINTIKITSGPYDGNGIADTFNYTFKIYNKTQLNVFETDDQGAEVLLTLDTDYTVNSIGDSGTVTRVAGPLPTDYQWFIRSDYKETQLTAFGSQGPFFPDIHEEAIDKLTMLVQQLIDDNSRTPSLSKSYTGPLPLLLGNPVAGQLIRWRGDLAGFENVEVTTTPIGTNVASIAGLRTLDINDFSSGDSVFVDGYFATNDGGGGPRRVLFKGSPVGFYTDDGGSVILPDAPNDDGSAAWLWPESKETNAAFWGIGADIGQAVNRAYAAGFSVVRMPTGVYGILTTIIRDDKDHLIGAGLNSTILEKRADVIGIEVVNGEGSLLDFSMTSDGSDSNTTSGIGILVSNGPRDIIDNVNVSNMGNHGIKHASGNLTKYGRIFTVNNGASGLFIDGGDLDTNGGTVEFLDSRGNGTDGLLMVGPWAQSWKIHALCQNNTGNGANITSVNSDIVVYSESNGASSTVLQAGSKGNRVKSLLSSVLDLGLDNIVFADLNTKGTQGIHKAKIKSLNITDGVTVGTWISEVTGPRELTTTGSGTGTTTWIIIHDQDGAGQRITFDLRGTMITEKMFMTNLEVFETDAAAGSGGIAQNQVYRNAAGVLSAKL